MPYTLKVTECEGGDWIPFSEFEGKTVHSIMFSNGDIWDAVNGWRKYRPEREPSSVRKWRSERD